MTTEHINQFLLSGAIFTLLLVGNYIIHVLLGRISAPTGMSRKELLHAFYIFALMTTGLLYTAGGFYLICTILKNTLHSL